MLDPKAGSEGSDLASVPYETASWRELTGVDQGRREGRRGKVWYSLNIYNTSPGLCEAYMAPCLAHAVDREVFVVRL